MSAEGRRWAVPTLRGAAYVLMAVGVVLRVARWASDRSLWLDEILLARNLLEKGWGELLGKLDYGQGAPPLFLMLEKGAVGLFGRSEMGMRLVPLVAGCLALWLMWEVGRRLFDERTGVVGVAILALLEPAIYYSSEVKQYSTDLMMTLAVMLGFLKWREEKWAWWVVCVIGVVGMFLSHPAVFVLAGCGVGLVLWERKRWRGVTGLAGVWGVAFILEYWFFLRGLRGDEGLNTYWNAGFMPWSWGAGVVWVGNAMLGVFADYATMWLRWPVVGFAIAGWGWAAVSAKSLGRGVFLIGPVVVALVAAGVHGYPFSGRLVLFLVPVAILMIAGVVYGESKGRAVGWVLAGVMVGMVAPRAMRNLIHPPGREEVEVVLAEMEKRVGAEESVYVYFGARAGWEYYGREFEIGARDVIRGSDRDADVEAFEKDVKKLRGRVWLLFAHTPTGDGGDARLMELLPAGARRVEEISAKGCAAYLYEF